MRFFSTVDHVRREKSHCVSHAPRQTEKTLALRDLPADLNDASEVRHVHAAVGIGATGRESVAAGMRAMLSPSPPAARHVPDDHWLASTRPGIRERAGRHDALPKSLSGRSDSDAKPSGLLIDTFHALIGDTRLAVLRQFRGGHPEWPPRFAQSAAPLAVRDLYDRRTRSGAENAIVDEGSVQADNPLAASRYFVGTLGTLDGAPPAQRGQPAATAAGVAASLTSIAAAESSASAARVCQGGHDDWAPSIAIATHWRGPRPPTLWCRERCHSLAEVALPARSRRRHTSGRFRISIPTVQGWTVLSNAL